jgi:hypothetical protein
MFPACPVKRSISCFSTRSLLCSPNVPDKVRPSVGFTRLTVLKQIDWDAVGMCLGVLAIGALFAVTIFYTL